MTSTATSDTPTRQTKPRMAFVAATTSLVVAFVASASPLPLYNTYRAENGVTTADLSLTVVAYFLGTIGAQLCLTRFSRCLCGQRRRSRRGWPPW